MMDANFTKMISTGFIWASVTAMGLVALLRDATSNTGMMVILGVLLIGGAVTATNFIWNGGKMATPAELEKSKRRGKIDRVLDGMSERDLDELRARLMADHDGEQVSLEDLLAERAGRR